MNATVKGKHYNRVLLFLLASFLFIQCTTPTQKIREADKQSMNYLDLFFGQEYIWVQAIASGNEAAAHMALDSMQFVTTLFSDSINISLSGLSPQDSLYFSELWVFTQYLSLLSDSIYPQITQSALLPEKEYTWREEQQIMLMLKTTDSIVNQKMKELKSQRAAL